MELAIYEGLQGQDNLDFEIIERKGRGHPDTLSDRLAETLSICYSDYTKERFGTILRHQFDKLMLMGGRCNIKFGEGVMVSPVRLVINGRTTGNFGNEKIRVFDLLINEAERFLENELKNFSFSKNCRVLFENTHNSTRGLIDGEGLPSINYRFSPRSANDLPEFIRPVSNDTAVGCAYAPFSKLELLILTLEKSLSSDDFIAKNKWLGTDIKIMGVRIREEISITVAVPQICTEVLSPDTYEKNKDHLKNVVENIVRSHWDKKYAVFINPSDSVKDSLYYLRLTGSCVESGDEGMVGRGNRIGGVIPSRRPFSIEGLNGKNPSCHAGKLYSVAAWKLANLIWEEFHVASEVYIVSQIDRPLDDPWKIIVNTSTKVDKSAIKYLVDKVLLIQNLTTDIILGNFPLS